MPSRNSFSIRKMLVSPRRLSLTVAAGPSNVPCDLKRYSGSSGSSGDSRLSSDTGQDSPQSSPDEPSQEEIERIRAVVAAARRRLVEGREEEERSEGNGKKDDEDGEQKTHAPNKNPETKQNSQNDSRMLPCPRDCEDALALAAQRRWRWRMAGNGNGRLCLGKEGGGEEGDKAKREGERRVTENGRNEEEWEEIEGEKPEAGISVFSPTLTLISTTTSVTSTITTATTTPTTTTPATTPAQRQPKKITKTAKRDKEGKTDNAKKYNESEKQKKKKKTTTATPERALTRRRSSAPASDTSSCIDLLEALMVQPPEDMAVCLSPTFTSPRAAPVPGASALSASTPTWQTAPPPNKRARRAFLPLRRQRSSSASHTDLFAVAAAGSQSVQQRQRSTKAVVTTRRRRAWMRAVAASPAKMPQTVTKVDEPAGPPAAKKQRYSGGTSGSGGSGGSGGSRWTLLPDNVAELFFGRGRMEVNEILSEEALQLGLPADVEAPEKKKTDTDDDAKTGKSEGSSATLLLPPCAPPPAAPLPPPPHIVLQCRWDEIELAEEETAEAETAPTAEETLLIPPLSPSPIEPFPLDDLPQRIGAAGVRLSVLLPVEEEAAYFEQQNAARRERERQHERKREQQRKRDATAAEDVVGKESDDEQDDAKTIRGGDGDVTPVPPDKNPLRYATGVEKEAGETTVLAAIPTLLVTDADAGSDVQAGASSPRPTTTAGKGKGKQPLWSTATAAKGKGKQVSHGNKRTRRVAAAAGTPSRLAPPSSSLRASPYRTTHGHSEEDAQRYAYLPSTPFSMVMPTFRHGPVRLSRPEVGQFGQSRRHAHQTDRQLQNRDEQPLDWTAFQMAILGGAGDLFSDSIDFGHRSAADVEELDDLVAWYASLGLSDQRLVGGEEAAEQEEQRQAESLSLPLPLPLPMPLPHIVEMPPSEVPRRPPSMGGPLELYGRAGPRPHFRDLSGGGDAVSRASVASYDSLPQSPMADVVLTRGADGKEYMAPPMGHNLGHDLGNFLQWETENVYAVALE